MKDRYTNIFVNDNIRDEYREKDCAKTEMINDIINNNNLSYDNILKNVMSFIQRKEVPKTLAMYELFKKVIELPGSIVDIGVFRGHSLFTWHHLLEIFAPADRMRFVYGFDSFEGYKTFTDEDGDAEEWCKQYIPDCMISNKNLVQELIRYHNIDSFFPGTERIKLIIGDINTTIPDFKENAKGIRISLLNIDTNLYSTVKTSLTYLFDLVVPHGVICFSGYSGFPWEGEAKAIEEYFHGRKFILRKFNWSPYPRAYMVKE